MQANLVLRVPLGHLLQKCVDQKWDEVLPAIVKPTRRGIYSRPYVLPDACL